MSFIFNTFTLFWTYKNEKKAVVECINFYYFFWCCMFGDSLFLHAIGFEPVKFLVRSRFYVRAVKWIVCLWVFRSVTDACSFLKVCHFRVGFFGWVASTTMPLRLSASFRNVSRDFVSEWRLSIRSWQVGSIRNHIFFWRATNCRDKKFNDP